ncbi:MAG: mitochondrial fission ELM1 family protein [Candidatus Omnitrophica bacterium]|nr:mitochondrial fission ELM1 family protein [Candidatus Omnitrophota bacterium]MCM8792925.1 mitochondrial fission ELM1 family protein [Candidatus Omnitrophota bacterium]
MVRFLSFSICHLPIGFSLFLARGMGSLFYYLLSRKAKLAYLNLKLAFGDKISLEKRKIMVKEVFRNLAMNLVEFLYFPRINEKYVKKYIKISGEEKIKQVLKRGRGLIFLTAHLGNWEFLSLVAQVKGYPLVVLAREQKPKRLNSLLNQYRTRLGARLVIRGSWMREILGSLRENRIVGILGDQKSGKGGVLVGLFSRLAWSPKGVFDLASHTQAGVLPVFIIREKGPYHRIEIGEEMFLTESSQEFLKNFHLLLEEYVRKYPSQWLWFHRRWKASPNKNILILSDGKAGHLNQAKAVARVIEKIVEDKFATSYRLQAKSPIVETKIVEVKFRNRFTKGLMNLFGLLCVKNCTACLRCLKLCLPNDTFNEIIHFFADIVVSCGASLSAINLILAKENQAKSIVVMKPGLIPVRRFDLAIIPVHDRPKPFRNIVVTQTALNLIDERAMREGMERLQATSDRLQAEKIKIGVLLGGESKNYSFTKEMACTVIEELLRVAKDLNAELLVTTSRRTTPGVEKVVKEKLLGNLHCPLLLIANEQNIEGAVPGILGLSDIVVVSAESISMVSEALTSAKPVVVFEVGRKGRIQDTKHKRFLDNLKHKGYISLVKAENIAEEIEIILRNRSLKIFSGERDSLYGMIKNLVS